MKAKFLVALPFLFVFVLTYPSNLRSEEVTYSVAFLKPIPRPPVPTVDFDPMDNTSDESDEDVEQSFWKQGKESMKNRLESIEKGAAGLKQSVQGVYDDLKFLVTGDNKRMDEVAKEADEETRNSDGQGGD